MSQKFIVCAIDRKNQGLEHVFRAGRGWAGGVDVEIEVLDQPGDVYLKDAEGNSTGKLDPVRMGLDAWAKLKADKRISWRPFGALTAAQALPKVAELETSNAALVARVGELTSEFNSTVEALQASKKENADLLAKIAEMEATLESLTAPAPKTEDLPKPKSKTVK